MVTIYKLDEYAIRQLMLKNSMTIRAAAKSAGLAETTLRRLLGERVRANSAPAGRLAKALGVEPEKLILTKESD